MKFGVRECADVVLRAKSNQKIGNKIFYKNEPVCYFDTLKTSTFEGAATTVYAQGGRGNARLMSWDGERTVTFTMEDALISPAGLAILTGAGLIDGSEKPIIQHITETTADVTRTSTSDPTITEIYVNNPPYEPNATENYIYVMALDEHGEVISEPYLFKADGDEPADNGKYKLVPKATGYTMSPALTAASVLVDYYTQKGANNMQIDITPDKFGGTYYLEASTLWRDQGTGQDLPAEFIIPSCKVQSNFSFTLASSGDPSSFTFTMDAFPDYTRWDPSKKVLASIQVMGASQDTDANLTREATKTTRVQNTDGIIVEQTGGAG